MYCGWLGTIPSQKDCLCVNGNWVSATPPHYLFPNLLCRETLSHRTPSYGTTSCPGCRANLQEVTKRLSLRGDAFKSSGCVCVAATMEVMITGVPVFTASYIVG